MNIINLFRRGTHAADTTSDPAQETMLRDAMKSAYAVGEVSHDLRGRIADMALLHAQQQVMAPACRLFSLRRCLLQMASAAACVFVALAVVAWPNIKTAYILYRMQSAVQNAYSVHAINWSYPLQNVYKRQEIWRQGDIWRIELQEGKHTDTFVKTVNVRFAQSPKPTSVMQATTAPTYGWVSGMSLMQTPLQAAMYGTYSRLEQIRVEEYGNDKSEGRRTIKYALHPYFYDKPHTFIWLDAETYLPVEIQAEAQGKHGIWSLRSSSLLDYNHPMNASAFVRP